MSNKEIIKRQAENESLQETQNRADETMLQRAPVQLTQDSTVYAIAGGATIAALIAAFLKAEDVHGLASLIFFVLALVGYLVAIVLNTINSARSKQLEMDGPVPKSVIAHDPIAKREIRALKERYEEGESARNILEAAHADTLEKVELERLARLELEDNARGPEIWVSRPHTITRLAKYRDTPFIVEYRPIPTIEQIAVNICKILKESGWLKLEMIQANDLTDGIRTRTKGFKASIGTRFKERAATLLGSYLDANGWRVLDLTVNLIGGSEPWELDENIPDGTVKISIGNKSSSRNLSPTNEKEVKAHHRMLQTERKRRNVLREEWKLPLLPE